MPAPILNGLDEAQVEKAARALLKYAKKQEENSKNILQEDEMIYLVCRTPAITTVECASRGSLAPC